MHLLKLVTGQGLDTSSASSASGAVEQQTVESSALLTAGPPSGVIGGVRGGGWRSANDNSVSSSPSSRASTRSRFAENNNRLLSILSIVSLILVVSNFGKMSGVSAMPRCPPQGVENVEPADCPYGISTDYCGRKVCAKGPGQICGVGLFKLLGSCGEGLYCNCGRCTGCSMLTMECFDKTCV